MMGQANSDDALNEVYGLSAEALKSTLPSPQQLDALMNLVRVDDPYVKQKIIIQNLRLVLNIAKRYSNYGVELLDLIREGIQGLIHALENFEREGGFHFESYAAQCVRWSFERVILNQYNHLPVNP